MKKLISVLITILLVFACAAPAFAGGPGTEQSSFGAYKHVFIIGVDGAGRFIKDADTPEFDRIFANGAVDYTARTEVPTDSGPNWGSILTGVSYFKHLIHNGNSGENERSSDTAYPSVFALARKAFPDAELASFVNWNNVNFGIIENDIGVTKVNITNDEKLTDAICDYFDAGNAPAVFFVQLDGVDAAGHAHGSASQEYFDAIHTADGYVGRIYDAVERNGLMEDGLFIVCADHGHKKEGGHGRFSMRETNTTVAVVGKTTVPGGTMDADTRDRDVAAITLYALGIEKTNKMTARVPAHVFADVKGELRPDYRDPLDWIISRFMWLITLCTALV
ncbi:MAG: alkaline phosphatase family protein [Clostridia bacterium]|nr:alkaline phosphatase family protein [Clostridia bacterium]